MGNRKYILDRATGRVSQVYSTTEWGDSFEKCDRVIGLDHLTPDVDVSTVFLGLDHNYGDSGPPILFETMVFSGDSWDDERCVRYATMAEAIEGHKRICEEIRAELGIPTPLRSHGLLRMWLANEGQ